ncbi:MAG: nitroreductase family protein [Clostridia bacterium]|nr:nitroreductase family protein [Clostridia bacterium]
MFMNLVNSRESCRHFLKKEVEREKLINCIEAARLAPSACNSQPWSFVIVNKEGLLEPVAKATQKIGMNKFTDNAGAFIVVCQEKANFTAKIGSVLQETAFQDIDIGIAVTHICYEATAQGLSTCILGMFDDKKIINTLNMPKNKKIKLVIAVGYAERDYLRKKVRKEFDEIAYFAE